MIYTNLQKLLFFTGLGMMMPLMTYASEKTSDNVMSGLPDKVLYSPTTKKKTSDKAPSRQPNKDKRESNLSSPKNIKLYIDIVNDQKQVIRRITLKHVAKDMSIRALQQKIEKERGGVVGQQYSLTFKGKELTLGNIKIYDIKDGSTLKVTLGKSAQKRSYEKLSNLLPPPMTSFPKSKTKNSNTSHISHPPIHRLPTQGTQDKHKKSADTLHIIGGVLFILTSCVSLFLMLKGCFKKKQKKDEHTLDRP